MYSLRCGGKLLTINQPVVMGILNTTPDSFFDQSRLQSVDTVLFAAEKMLTEGAAILDVGGQSTRPGANQIGQEAEAQRVLPAIEAIARRFPEAIISVDTYHSQVAAWAVAAGAAMVNDISGGQLDESMLKTVAALQVPYVCMHTKGSPETMQQQAQYQQLIPELLQYFIHRLKACDHAGIKDVIIDPGFGFAKTIDHNFQLLKQLDQLQVLQRPLLLGVSRKSTICKTLGITAAEALNGTTVLHTVGLMKGAAILRVHDVREAMEAITLLQAMQNA
jgi:dihydropteroate synthase